MTASDATVTVRVRKRCSIDGGARWYEVGQIVTLSEATVARLENMVERCEPAQLECPACGGFEVVWRDGERFHVLTADTPDGGYIPQRDMRYDHFRRGDPCPANGPVALAFPDLFTDAE